ncbi:Vacuolar protein sorting-associated protein VTA1-like protein [Planoprotostelium fungivorum]|uniref:Vacuolar protein sorting-associated protein VTA1-like protein n=1 Tax=Planoprotostelium fungivorum TaxID=1890364 RepID=A0A2P6NS52_9EUKA|nr:Vacuolar protein sorting-associated protein VTA1-like protein [Planoprotostelium fungivorum]
MNTPPPALKPLVNYFKQATILQKHDPVTAYYCGTYGVQEGVSLRSKVAPNDPAVKKFLLDSMDYLDDRKSQLGGQLENGQDKVMSTAMKAFNAADNQDRSGQATKETAATFLTSSILLQVLTQFGPLSPEVSEKIKYAKWKAADIMNAIRNGQKPKPGSKAEQELESELSTMAAETNNTATPSVYNESPPQNHQSTQQFDTYEAPAQKYQNTQQTDTYEAPAQKYQNTQQTDTYEAPPQKYQNTQQTDTYEAPPSVPSWSEQNFTSVPSPMDVVPPPPSSFSTMNIPSPSFSRYGNDNLNLPAPPAFPSVTPPSFPPPPFETNHTPGPTIYNPNRQEGQEKEQAPSWRQPPNGNGYPPSFQTSPQYPSSHLPSPPSSHLPSPPSVPPSWPLPPPSYPSPPPSQPPSLPPSQPQPQYQPQPKPQPQPQPQLQAQPRMSQSVQSKYEPTMDDTEKAIKYTRYVLSSLQFDDTSAAVKNLKLALKQLTGVDY